MTLVEIGNILHQKRRAQHKLLKDLRAETGMHPANLSEIERGKRPQVRFETLERYCQALGLEIIIRCRHGQTHGEW